MNHNPRQFAVSFSWASGDRLSLKPGRRYTTVSRIPGDNTPWPETAWSLTIHFAHGYSGSGQANAVAEFVSEKAPMHLIFPGVTIELYEGRHLVAYAKVR